MQAYQPAGADSRPLESAFPVAGADMQFNVRVPPIRRFWPEATESVLSL